MRQQLTSSHAQLCTSQNCAETEQVSRFLTAHQHN